MCWVCLGTGKLEVAPGVRTACHKCDGSAQCHVCTSELDWQQPRLSRALGGAKAVRLPPLGWRSRKVG